MRLCCLSSRRPGVILSCQLVVAIPLVVLSLRHPLIILSRQLVVASPLVNLSLCCPLVVLSRQLLHCLLPSSCCATLSSTRRTSLLSHRLASSSHCTPRCPLVLSSCRLVVVSPLDALPSRHLVVLLCRLLLSRHASWLLRHHLLSSSRCTALSSSHRAGWWLLHCLFLRRPLVLSS